MRPITGIAYIAAALERGEDMEPVCRQVVAAVKESGPHAPYIAPVPESAEDDTSPEAINAARIARGLEPLS